MATYDAIPGAEIAIDEAVKSSTTTKLRDNPLAVTQGDATALAAGEGVAIDNDFGGGSQTAIVTDETDDKLVCSPDGAGQAQWSPSPGWTLVEKKEIAAAVATVSFTGLDGDTDEVYRLIARIRKTPAGNATYSLRPNGLTTNLAGSTVTNGAAAVTAALLNLVTTGANAAIQVSTEIMIHAKETVQFLSQARMFQGKTIEGDPLGSALNAVVDMGGMWDGTGNMTSLDIDSTLASGIGVGSTFELFKLRQ